ncbi:hypothetical protein FACS1894137_06260 [Spirochaetia bacterium]|nr:hypothetical protein FACS1894137_06260 [Spirochaetia bacterium]
MALLQIKDIGLSFGGFELKPHWVKCPKCKKPVTEEGAKEPRKCSCGEPLEDWMDECPACGKKVGKGAAAAKAQPTAVTQAEPGMDEEEQKYSAEAVACRKRGKELRENEDYEGAIREFSKAIELEPDYYSAYVGRGLAYQGKEEYDRAIADFTRAIKIDPDAKDVDNVYNVRAETYREQEDYASAIADYTKAIQINPDASFAFCGRGEAYSGNGDDARAIKDFSKAIQLNPEYVWALYCRGLSYQHQEEYGLSTNDFTEVIRLLPNSAPAYKQRGCNYYIQEDDDSAIRDCTKAIGFNPDDDYTYYLRGLCYSRKEKYDAAIQDFSKAIKIDGNDYRYYKERGDAYIGNENYNAAISDFTQAIEMSEKDDDVSRKDWAYLFGQRGFAWGNLENKEMALADFETAVELDPSESLYRENRDKCKGCFITTAVCQSFSKPDDCYELTAFRDFRDNWLAKQPDGEAIIKRYYNTAPQIVSAINRRTDKDAVYLGIWNEYLAECLHLIEAGELEDCKKLYVQMVERLENGFFTEEEK